MPQPHITNETFKGLTPEEQEKYGEEVPQVQPLIIYPDEHWRDLKPGETVENMNQLGRKTRIIHYLKPVEAQQSEAEGVEAAASKLFPYVTGEKIGNRLANQKNVQQKLQRSGFALGAVWRQQQDAAQLTALQQAVERLKEAQVWVPVSESFPKVGVEVLVFDDDWIKIATFKENGKWRDVEGEPLDCVTHWQPLPPPPTN